MTASHQVEPFLLVIASDTRRPGRSRPLPDIGGSESNVTCKGLPIARSFANAAIFSFRVPYAPAHGGNAIGRN